MPDLPSAADAEYLRSMEWVKAMRDPKFDQGYRAAIKEAVAWLHRRAREMNDPHAVSVLNSAATNLGWDYAASKTGGLKVQVSDPFCHFENGGEGV